MGKKAPFMNFLKVFNKFTKWALQDKHIILLFLWPSIFLLVLTKYFVVAKSKQPGGQIPVKRQKKKKKKRRPLSKILKLRIWSHLLKKSSWKIQFLCSVT